MIGLLVIARTLWDGMRTFMADPRSRGLLTLTLCLVAVGAFFYRLVEDLSWIDSIYFTIVTLATVGYGDIAPQTTAGKVFTIAYLFIGIGIVVAFAGEVAGHVMRAGAHRRGLDDERSAD